MGAGKSCSSTTLDSYSITFQRYQLSTTGSKIGPTESDDIEKICQRQSMLEVMHSFLRKHNFPQYPNTNWFCSMNHSYYASCCYFYVLTHTFAFRVIGLEHYSDDEETVFQRSLCSCSHKKVKPYFKSQCLFHMNKLWTSHRHLGIQMLIFFKIRKKKKKKIQY